MKERNGAKTAGGNPGRKLTMILAGSLVAVSVFSPMGGKVAYAFDQLGGNGTSDDPWQITNRQQLELIGYAQYSYSSPYILMNDIDLSDANWFPIRYLSGTFDGNGKKITGLNIDMPDDDNVGLFAEILNGHVYNLTVETGQEGITGHDNVGIIAGSVEQTDDDDNGMSTTSLMFISATGDVKGNKNVGGLVGKASGDDNASMAFAYNHIGPGTVTGANSVGGLAGFLMSGLVYSSHAEAFVAAGEGDAEEDHSRIGGLLGAFTDSNVTRSYSAGTVDTSSVSPETDDVGGLIGSSMSSNIRDSYSTAHVSGGNAVGGLIGYTVYDLISRSYAAGEVEASGTQAGGLIGLNNQDQTQSFVRASYWDTEASHQPDLMENDDRYGRGLDTMLMKIQATFTSDSETDNNWDFEHVWHVEGGRYPQLYAGMDIRFHAEPQFVSNQSVSEHEVTFNMDSEWLGYGHHIRVYDASDDDTPVDSFVAGTHASVPVMLDTAGMNDGTHTLNAGYYFEDQYGNRTSVFHPSIAVDSTSPVWDNGASIAKNETNGSIELTWDEASDGEGSGIDHYNVYVDGLPHQVEAPSDTLTAPPTSAVYEIEAVDRAGNKSMLLAEGAAGTPSTTNISGSKNIVIGPTLPVFYTASVTGAPTYSAGIFGPVYYGGTMAFYVDGVLQTDNVPLTSIVTGLPPYGIFNWINYNDISEGAHTIKAVYSGYTGDFHGTNYAVDASEATYEITLSGLNVTSIDPSGAENNGKTKLTVSPDAAAGHKLVYRNFGVSDVTQPNVGDVLPGTGYADLPAGGLVPAAMGDKIGVVEVDISTGKVVHYGQAMAFSMDEPEGPGAAAGLTVTSADPSGAENDGKTKLTVTPDATEGNKQVYRNFGSGSVTVPNVGDVLTGYADLPADGLIAAASGDKIAVAEVDASTGQAVRFGQTTAVVTDEPAGPDAAAGLTVTSADPSGAENDGKTKLTVTPSATEGNKLVYRSFGSGSVTVPNVGDVLTGYADLPADGLIAAASGDKIAVAEVDAATGQVVRFGQATAVVTDEPAGPDAATGLTVTSADPSGAENDGKTKLTVTPSATEGNKLVYRNFGSGSVTVPNVGDVLTGYADLPIDGLIAAASGDKIAVAEVDAATGQAVRFGQATAVVTDEPAGPGAAAGLTVTSVDPSGAENDGKTKLTVTPDATEGNKLVYRSFGSGSVTVPNVGDVLTGYADLPADGLIAAASGDKIAVAEVDAATGQAVRFGQATAVVTDEPAGPDAAAGLTVTSADPSGAENDGKTKLTVSPDATEGNKQVYRNFGSGSVTVPNVGDVLTGYADLPADGLIAATSGDKIAVAEVDASTGQAVRFGQTTAVVTNEPTVTPNKPSPGSSTSVPSATDDVEVLVNGKAESLGKSKTSEVGGMKKTTITIDPAKLQAKLDAEGSHAVVTIPVNTAADSIIGELNGQLIKNMENASATLVLRTERATYTLPAAQINIDAISAQLGQSVALEDIKLQVEIAVPAADQVKLVENAAEKGTFTLVVPPVEFTIRAIYGDQTVEVASFNAYVERTIAIPDGVDLSKITTGVVVDPDGTVRHVPTKIVMIDGKPYAKISSLTNSMYSVVWHPIEFADMTKHWAKDAVNDMGSRMIIEGTGNGLFSPDREITRAEFAAIVVRALGLKQESGAGAFSDVAASDWYAGAVNAAVKHGLINGFEDGAFRPSERITREQAMAIVAKAMKVTGLKDRLPAQSTEAALRSFADVAEASGWAKAGIADSLQAGIVTGRGDAVLAPKANVTRAEVAMMVRNLLQKSDLI
ncbi:S-layer homology domain-containing protein [Paenibacillus lycopersici]|uniref:S-layer homology domain-containing protein n=1 Tax=Paenibacillus lycopersici TaxID=2704462 RepID=A0A6C0FWW4_9BACL|nr:S-layer homology domain-containing protein [Paenibacillus lycopersici]QHT61217.1 S-layer homology domain-containing protein [Paenibacillus lycopersici]